MPNDYIEASDLTAFITGIDISATGVMTTAQADDLIQMIEGEVNGICFQIGIDAPITQADSPNAFKVIRAICLQGVVAMMQSSIHAVLDDTEGSREAAFWRRYERAIRNLIDSGGAQLADALTFTDSSERNGAPTFSDQGDNIDRYLGMRDLTHLRHADNVYAAGRLYRGRATTRYFDGGIP